MNIRENWSMSGTNKAHVLRDGHNQAVRIPVEYRFTTDEIDTSRDQQSNAITVSEEPCRPSTAEIFTEFDAVGAANFVLERDLSLPTEPDFL